MNLLSPRSVIVGSIVAALSCGWLLFDKQHSSSHSKKSARSTTTTTQQSPAPAPRSPSGHVVQKMLDEPEAPNSNPAANTDNIDEIAHYTLENAFSNDAQRGADSMGREVSVRNAFTAPAIASTGGYLKRLDCKASICRGELMAPNAEAEHQIFAKVVLSGELAQTVSGAFTIASNERMPDGSMLATFFVHPDEVLEGIED